LPAIGAVVSTVGSGVMTQGIGPGTSFLEIVGTAVASWTYRGRRLPYVRNVIPPELTAQVETGRPVELALAFRDGFADEEAVKAATIPVERIRGGVLLISAGDDRMWPSQDLSEIARRRLEDARRPYASEHVVYPDAGHAIAPPPFGPSMDLLSPGPGVTFRVGGSGAANAHARADAWRRSIAFLADQLGG
jgi:dienelactone hydrolase